MGITPADASKPDNVATLQIMNHRKDDVNRKTRQTFEVGVRNRKGIFDRSRSYDVKYGGQLVVDSQDRRYAVLSNGEKVDRRRLARVAAIEEEPPSHQAVVEKQTKVRKSRALGEIAAKGRAEMPMDARRR